jgi:hypothetical protein
MSLFVFPDTPSLIICDSRAVKCQFKKDASVGEAKHEESLDCAGGESI